METTESKKWKMWRAILDIKHVAIVEKSMGKFMK